MITLLILYASSDGKSQIAEPLHFTSNCHSKITTVIWPLESGAPGQLPALRSYTMMFNKLSPTNIKYLTPIQLLAVCAYVDSVVFFFFTICCLMLKQGHD